MDPLVLAAGTALVGAMATDAWQQARTSAVELWRRVHPERVPAIEAELAEVREEVLTAREADDADAETGLAQDWQRKLQRLVRDHPELARELRRVLDQELAPLLPRPGGPAAPGTVTMTATAGDNSTVIQGRDITLR
ncbi:transketolase [Streptomyces capillispiralis]|uniref:Uncharacterized protein n=1 Tax=Streptomyces capillispiralis TaxID=68182 RepID=A0A561TBK4_9ACTN|nr:transketolase [Streptomyces capillispiralis]TWF84500.1 hypothetical protein FHX78_111434 [Streptomyces capillispiralis]GHH92046.1 hypothetical protein GCM10017779_25030 [Streptomyces capillispiralis]